MFKESHVEGFEHPQGFILARHYTSIMSIKSTIAAIAASPFLLAGAAFAGPYVNVESNLSYPDGDYSAATTDVHVGYEGGEGQLGYYVQAGPAFVHSETDSDTETESESSSSGYLSNKEEKPKMLKGYMKNTKKYKKILFEDTIFPE